MLAYTALAADALGLPVLTRNGSDGRVYGGDKDLCHIPDGTRGDFGVDLAAHIMTSVRALSAAPDDKLICPGCYMIALFNAAVALARANGQPLVELAATMRRAFAELEDREAEPLIEEIIVQTIAEAA
jgi:hypothetical protein